MNALAMKQILLFFFLSLFYTCLSAQANNKLFKLDSDYVPLVEQATVSEEDLLQKRLTTVRGFKNMAETKARKNNFFLLKKEFGKPNSTMPMMPIDTTKTYFLLEKKLPR